jgi:hypothetical protein
MSFLVVIGEGERHSDESTNMALELADLETTGDDGVNVQIYKPGSRWKGDNHGSADRGARAQRDRGAGR